MCQLHTLQLITTEYHCYDIEKKRKEKTALHNISKFLFLFVVFLGAYLDLCRAQFKNFADLLS